MLRAALALTAAASVAACTIPKTGPSTDTVITSGDGSGVSEQPYSLVPISRSVVATLEAHRSVAPSGDRRFASQLGPLYIGAGDLLSITI